MDASIVVCTYNRAESLRDTLAALRSLAAPSDLNWEVLVVDNNSKDHTRAVAEEAMVVWPRLRYVFEARQGLSRARNRGIAETSGRIILFTDDDVLPEADWLTITLSGMDRYQADACGGYIAPIWETPPPDWLTERFYGFLAIRTDREDYPITTPAQAPFGANMAFSRNVFNQVGLFDTSRGRNGDVLASGEDGEMFSRMLDADIRTVFLGGSRVHHKVDSFRLTKNYFRRWRFQTSHNLALNRGIPGSRRLLNIPLYLFPQLARAIGKTLTGHLTQTKDVAFNREMIVCHFLGTISGLYQARLDSK